MNDPTLFVKIMDGGLGMKIAAGTNADRSWET
jgi:hypothetical protein